MRKHLADFRLMADSGELDGAVEFLPEHQAALRYESVGDSLSKGILGSHQFYGDDQDSLFSDVLIYGDLEDLKKFHSWVSAFLSSGRDYDLRRIFTVNYEKFSLFINHDKSELISEKLNCHFEFLLGLMSSVDAGVLASSVNDELKPILASFRFPALYVIFIDFLLNYGLSAGDAAKLLIGLSPVDAENDKAKIYYLMLLNKLLKNKLEFRSAYDIFSALFFPGGPLGAIPGYVKSIPLALVLDALIKLNSHADVDLGRISHAFSILKYVILSEAQVDEYLTEISSLPRDQALAIHFELLQRYEAADFSGGVFSVGVYLKLVDALKSFECDLPTICEFLIKLNLEDEHLSLVLNHVIASFKGVDDEKKGQVVDLVYRLMTNEEFLAKPKNRADLQKLAHVVISGKALKELIFEHMQEKLPSELRVQLFQGIIDQFTGRASPASAGGVAASASASSAVVDPVILALTAFFSQSRGLTPASLGSGVLKKINDALRYIAEKDRALEESQATLALVGKLQAVLEAVASGVAPESYTPQKAPTRVDFPEGSSAVSPTASGFFAGGLFSRRSTRDLAEETLISAVVADARVKLSTKPECIVGDVIEIIEESYIEYLRKSSGSITNADESVGIIMKAYEAITPSKISAADRKLAETFAHDFIDPRVVDSSDAADNNRL